MKVLAILQNMYVNNPGRVKALLERSPQARRRMITYALFAGCRTGRILKQVFGDDCPKRFIWDESTREIAGDARTVYPPDYEHLQTVLREVEPDVVIAFGRVAADALAKMVPGERLLVAPHPTARQPDTLQRLRWTARALESMGARRG